MDSLMIGKPLATHRLRILITGGTAGLGLATAQRLAVMAHDIEILGRSKERLRTASQAVEAATDDRQSVTTWQVDLADHTEVRDFFSTRAAGDPLDVLINNAGIMAVPDRRSDDRGHELQLSVNHLAAYEIAARLLPLIRRSGGGRIVWISSIRHHQGEPWGTPWNPTRYNPREAYNTSKLWNLAFALWLDNRLTTDASETRSVACHPGWSRTGLAYANNSGRGSLLRRAGATLLAQSADRGAIPIIGAATAPLTDRFFYAAPNEMGELRGKKVIEGKISPTASNEGFQEWVAERSAQLTEASIET
jgi:NAD(P)-dependent dehydrogenase (short-subunit alcohol dehydrogenase family)